MAYTYFVASTTALAEEVVANFEHVASGDRLPMGGSSLAATTGVYNLGDSNTTWNNIFCQNLELSGSISANNKLWTPILDLVLTSSSAAFQAASLTADNTVKYRFLYALRCGIASTATSYEIKVFFTTPVGGTFTTSSSYVSQDIILQSTAVSTAQTAVTTHWSMAYINGTTTMAINDELFFFGTADLSIKTGAARAGNGKSHAYYSTTVFGQMKIQSFFHSNTVDTVGSIIVACTNSYMLTGSIFQLWGRT